jgi:hypothetical protein
MNDTIDLVIAKHAGLLSTQLRQLSTNRYFLDTHDEIKTLCNDQYEIKFSPILVGTIADVTVA